MIPDNEPVLLIRGQDQAAIPAGRAWVDAHLEAGGDPALATLALQHLERIAMWQSVRGSKVADLPGVDR